MLSDDYVWSRPFNVTAARECCTQTTGRSGVHWSKAEKCAAQLASISQSTTTIRSVANPKPWTSTIEGGIATGLGATSHPNNRMDVGVIAGVTAGAVLAVGLPVVGFLWWRRRRQLVSTLGEWYLVSRASQLPHDDHDHMPSMTCRGISRRRYTTGQYLAFYGGSSASSSSTRSSTG